MFHYLFKLVQHALDTEMGVTAIEMLVMVSLLLPFNLGSH